MCGIAGIVRTDKTSISVPKCVELFNAILLHSQSRGRDSSGVAVLSSDEIHVYKGAVSAGRLIASNAYGLFFAPVPANFAAIGHARMETDGTFSDQNNNQPVIKDGIVLVHNGIIVNHQELWQKYRGTIERCYDVDTEVINALLRMNFASRGTDLEESVRATFLDTKGAFSIAAFLEDFDALLLATNTGSLYTLEDRTGRFLAFASEQRFLENSISAVLGEISGEFGLRQMKPGTGVIVNLQTALPRRFSLVTAADNVSEETGLSIRRQKKLRISLHEYSGKGMNQDRRLDNNSKHAVLEKLIVEEYEKNRERVEKLRRCSRCVLPETMPFIRFDESGICNYCHKHLSRETRGRERLEKDIERFRRHNGQPECILPFSGGRDSSYALHFVTKELGLKPLAYSYDWGMLTDLGRRNQARMTGKLGVEHILVSADIQKKRNYIRRNVLAWLKKPHIGLVPLFMAGDKQYFYHLNRLRSETGVQLVIYADNSLEKTDFKYGFAGIELDPEVGKAYDIGRFNTLKLLWFYFRHYTMNPRYLNSSFMNTFTAYLSSYYVAKDYLHLYRYIHWDEKEVERILFGSYDWETSPDTKSTWRIGDGTASFYNYIYYTATGFTENDTFRSNQIREGAVTREEALREVHTDNRPRVDSILWYCNTIGIDALHAIKSINAMKRFY